MTNTTDTAPTLFDYGATMVAASAQGMKAAVVAFALAQANGYLPKGHPQKLDLGKAREAHKAALKSMSPETARAVSALFPKVASTFAKRYNRPDSGHQFWQCLTMEPADAVAFAASHAKGDGWDGTWRGLKEWCGIKAKARDAVKEFNANLRAALSKTRAKDETGEPAKVTPRDFDTASLAMFDDLMGQLIAFRATIGSDDVSED